MGIKQSSIDAKENKVCFLDEIRQQPTAIRRFLDQAYVETELQNLIKNLMESRKTPHIVMTGMGSSLYACYITKRFLRNHGMQVSTLEAHELDAMEAPFFTEDTIVIAVSQSGESPEVLEVLKKIPKNIPVIAVTNYLNSHLSTMTEMVSGIYAGTEYLTSTKTYTNTLAAMLLLACRIAQYSEEKLMELRDCMEQCADKMEKIIADENLGKNIAEFISNIRYLICVGGGYSYTTACHSEIVLEEAGKFYASRFTPAQFIHGPIELIGDGFGVLIYDFDQKYSSKCDSVREHVLAFGGKVLLITNRTDVVEQENQLTCVIAHEDSLTSILLEILPLELGIEELCNSRGVAAGELSRIIKRIVE